MRTKSQIEIVGEAGCQIAIIEETWVINMIRRMGRMTYNIIHGEYSCPSLQLPSPPILVASIHNLDHVTLFKGEFARFRWFKCVEGADAGDHRCNFGWE